MKVGTKEKAGEIAGQRFQRFGILSPDEQFRVLLRTGVSSHRWSNG
jgi:hypothetical protein